MFGVFIMNNIIDLSNINYDYESIKNLINSIPKHEEEIIFSIDNTLASISILATIIRNLDLLKNKIYIQNNLVKLRIPKYIPVNEKNAYQDNLIELDIKIKKVRIKMIIENFEFNDENLLKLVTILRKNNRGKDSIIFEIDNRINSVGALIWLLYNVEFDDKKIYIERDYYTLEVPIL